MKTKIAIAFALLFSISAALRAQSTASQASDPTYRTVGKTQYLVLNPSAATLLYQLESKTSKNQPAVTEYFFSKGSGKIQKLTIKNVKSAFADIQFDEALDAEFKSDEELTRRDSLTRLAALFEIQEEISLMASGASAASQPK